MPAAHAPPAACIAGITIACMHDRAQTGAALMLYSKFVEPFLQQHEPAIDELMHKGHALLSSKLAALKAQAAEATTAASAGDAASDAAAASPSAEKTKPKKAPHVD